MENVDQSAEGQVAQLEPVPAPTPEAAAAPVPEVPVLTETVNVGSTVPEPAPDLANDPQLVALAAENVQTIPEAPNGYGTDHPNHGSITEHMAQIEELAKYWGGEIAIQVRNHLGFIRDLL